MNVTYLGPAGVTFSAIAYEQIAERFGFPSTSSTSTTLSLAKTNDDVLPLLVRNRGYGIIAMETKAEGRVDPPVHSFINLLRTFDDSTCPFKVALAFQKRIVFSLLARKGVSMEDLKLIVAHPKALGACALNIKQLGIPVEESTSNGQAAEDVATKEKYASAGAIAPIQAGEFYKLDVLVNSFEDTEAVTTFFLLKDRDYSVVVGEYKARSLRTFIVFRVDNSTGVLVKVLSPFAWAGINLRSIHSSYFSDGAYDFAIEMECKYEEFAKLEDAISVAECYMNKYIRFGPYPVFAE